MNGEILLNHIGLDLQLGFNIHKPAIFYRKNECKYNSCLGYILFRVTNERSHNIKDGMSLEYMDQLVFRSRYKIAK